MEPRDTQNDLNGSGNDLTKVPKPMSVKRNPFAAGYKPSPGKSKQGQSARYITKKNLLKIMLDVDLTVADLPLFIADAIRKECPGFLDAVEKKFTMYQLMELVQLQLLFSPSHYVRQDAINAIKDRVEGRPMQKIQLEGMDAEPAEMVLPGGRVIVI